MNVCAFIHTIIPAKVYHSPPKGEHFKRKVVFGSSFWSYVKFWGCIIYITIITHTNLHMMHNIIHDIYMLCIFCMNQFNENRDHQLRGSSASWLMIKISVLEIDGWLILHDQAWSPEKMVWESFIIKDSSQKMHFLFFWIWNWIYKVKCQDWQLANCLERGWHHLKQPHPWDQLNLFGKGPPTHDSHDRFGEDFRFTPAMKGLMCSSTHYPSVSPFFFDDFYA